MEEFGAYFSPRVLPSDTCKLTREPKGIKYVQFIEEDRISEEIASFYCLGQLSKNSKLVISRYSPFASNQFDRMTYLNALKGKDMFETSTAITVKFVVFGINCYLPVTYLLKNGPIYKKFNFGDQ